METKVQMNLNEYKRIANYHDISRYEAATTEQLREHAKTLRERVERYEREYEDAKRFRPSYTDRPTRTELGKAATVKSETDLYRIVVVIATLKEQGKALPTVR